MARTDPTAPNATLTRPLSKLLDAGWRLRAGALGTLELLEPLRHAIDAYERQLVIAARNEGKTWEMIGDVLNVPRQTAHRRHGKAAPKKAAK